MFRGRTLLIATMHSKETAIAPILERELGVRCIVPADFDTDQLGTFTGEVERRDDPLTSARKKCHLAMKLSECNLAIASEGSFGAHPAIGFVPADEEILVFIDKLNELEIVVRELSTETNFNASEIYSESELTDFADTAHFPTHGLILRRHKGDFTEIKKGIIDRDILIETYHHLSNRDGMAYVETDMRAKYNPTRMKVIRNATQRLATKIKSTCPECHCPGFGITRAITGLPCELCHFPTRSIKSYIYTCLKCNFTKEERHPSGKLEEEPLFCDHCNP